MSFNEGPSGDERDADAVAGEVHSRLPARVARPDDDGGEPLEVASLARCRAVEHAGTDELLDRRHAQPPVRHPAGQDHGAGGGDGTVGQPQSMRDAGFEPHHVSPHVESGPEAGGLDDAPPSELAPGDAAREPEVVADHRARARLPTERLSLDDQRRQPLRCAVHRGAQAGRTSPDDREVEDGVGHVDDGTERHGQLPVGRIGEERAPHHLDEREPGPRAGRRGEVLPDGRLEGVDSGRSSETLQQITDLDAAPGVVVDDHPDRLHGRRRRPRPLTELLGDRAMELLIPRARRAW